jgi:glycogen debranching enzyme
VVAPASFNAIAADAAGRLPRSPELRGWGQELGRQIDRQLWNPEEGLWNDRPGESHRRASPRATLPTLDGVLGALGTQSRERAEMALRQCVGDGRFSAPFGPRFLPAGHHDYQPDVYWRGPAWPQLNYLLVVAARRHGLGDIAAELTETTLRGVVTSGFSEFWHPETGEARGATPQSWATVAVALLAPVEVTPQHL